MSIELTPEGRDRVTALQVGGMNGLCKGPEVGVARHIPFGTEGNRMQKGKGREV